MTTKDFCFSRSAKVDGTVVSLGRGQAAEVRAHRSIGGFAVWLRTNPEGSETDEVSERRKGLERVETHGRLIVRADGREGELAGLDFNVVSL